MKSHINGMIAEHANLVIKLEALENYIYSDQSELDDKVEYANKCLQLKGMRIYEEALRARLQNIGIELIDNKYAEVVASIEEHIPCAACLNQQAIGSDSDINTPERCCKK